MKFMAWSDYDIESYGVQIIEKSADGAAKAFVSDRHSSQYEYATDCLCWVKSPGIFGCDLYRVSVDSKQLFTAKLLQKYEEKW